MAECPAVVTKRLSRTIDELQLSVLAESSMTQLAIADDEALVEVVAEGSRAHRAPTLSRVLDEVQLAAIAGLTELATDDDAPLVEWIDD